MSKFDRAARTPTMSGPVSTTATQTRTEEGGVGWERDAKSELFLLAVTNLVSEDTFYEGAKERDNRYVQLVRQVSVEDPDWVARLVRWLRADANMRSASIVAAAEYAWARRDEADTGRTGTTYPKPTISTRSVITAALLRADEPAEMIAYWHSAHGRNLPQPVKRGIADAALRLYSENSALKYDGQSRSFRMGDIVDLTHPKPSAVWQHDLFRWLLDKRHNRDEPRVGESLQVIREHTRLEAVPVAERRALLRSWGANANQHLAAAGMTWESLSGWLQGPMDKEAWESIIPSMGYMAQLRNLRNFDEAGVSDKVAAQVAARLADPEQVAKSRQFPLRFLSAYKAAPSLRWSWPLEQAVGLSLANVPVLPGRTLVLVDLSGSMWESMSARSELKRYEAAALFGFALANRAENAEVYCYGTNHVRVPLVPAGSLLPAVKRLQNMGGTDTFGTLAQTYSSHDRVVILTDEQAHTPGFSSYYRYGYGNTVDPETVLKDMTAPVITFNLAGYKAAHLDSGSNRVTIGGLTDKGFTMIDLLNKRAQGHWPF